MQNPVRNSALKTVTGLPMLQPAARSIAYPVTYDALILDARLRQSLVALRSLGRQGLQVAALECTDSPHKRLAIPAFSSRWCQRAYKAFNYLPHSEPFMAYLLHILEYTRARVLLTSSDGTLALIRKHRRVVERQVRVALAREEALAVACNKERTLVLAERLGLAVPKGRLVHSARELTSALNEIGLPAVVKPVETWSWEAGRQSQGRLLCELVTTQGEALRAVEHLTAHGGGVLLQQYLPGRREAVSFLYAQGTFYARFAQWAKRTQPPLGGSSVLRQSIALPPDITAQAELLVRELDLEGYSEVEFRRDAAGKPFLMEINPRLSASVELAVRSGVDFPFLLYQWACGEPLERVQSYRVGSWMRYLEGDIVTTLQMLAQHGRPGVPSWPRVFSEFFGAFLLPCGYDYLDWHDPLPAYTAIRALNERLHAHIQKSVSLRRMWW